MSWRYSKTMGSQLVMRVNVSIELVSMLLRVS